MNEIPDLPQGLPEAVVPSGNGGTVPLFLAQENLLDEAFEFLEEHRNMPSPFESIAFVDCH